MRHRLMFISLPLVALFLAVSPTALASTKWYVDGVNGSDNNNCKSRKHACKTIGHAISLAGSGDSIMVAAATYTENVNIGISLKVIGSGAKTTIIDGRGSSTVVIISNANAHATLSKLTIQNGSSSGIYDKGTLTINNSTVAGNGCCGGSGGSGGGISNSGTLTINNSTVSGNSSIGFANGGGILNRGTLTINNSTISGNTARYGGGIETYQASTATQNSIVANNSGGNCQGTMTSNGYNLSSDGSCNFNGTGNLNNTDPKLGPLQNNGGPTQTQALLSGSPAIDAGNPSGCTDGNGRLLKTDQRGKPRPDKEDTGGCDMGAYERQKD